MKSLISGLELLSEDEDLLSEASGQLETISQKDSGENITRGWGQGDSDSPHNDSVRPPPKRSISFSDSIDIESGSSHEAVLFPWSDEANPSTWTMWRGIEENVKQVYTGKASRSVSPSPAAHVECLEPPSDVPQRGTIQPEWSHCSSLHWHHVCLLYVAFKRADVEHCESAFVEDIRHTFFHDDIVQHIFSLHLSPERHKTCYSQAAPCPPQFVKFSWEEKDSLAESREKKHKETGSESLSLSMLSSMNDMLNYLMDCPFFHELPGSHMATRIQSFVSSGQVCRKVGGSLKTYVMKWLHRWMDGHLPSPSITYESSHQKLQQMLQVLHQLKIRAIRCIDQRQTGSIKISFPKYAEAFRPFLYNQGDKVCPPQDHQRRMGNLLLTPQEKQNFLDLDFCNRLVRDGYLGTNFLSYDFPRPDKMLPVPKTLTMETLSDNGSSLSNKRPTSPEEGLWTSSQEDKRDVMLDALPHSTTGASKEKRHGVQNRFFNQTKELQDLRRCLASNQWDQFVRKSSLVSYPSLIHTQSKSYQPEK